MQTIRQPVNREAVAVELGEVGRSDVHLGQIIRDVKTHDGRDEFLVFIAIHRLGFGGSHETARNAVHGREALNADLVLDESAWRKRSKT